MTKEGIKLLCRNSIDISINTHISKSMASVKYIIKSFIVSCMISLTIYAQGEITSNNLDGYYIADLTYQYGNVIQITSDSLMVYDWEDFVRDNPDSLSVNPRAICKIDKCSENFYELNSIGGSVLSVWKDMSISADIANPQQGRLKDMSVYFNLPNLKKEMLLKYYDEDNQEITDTIINGEVHVFLKDFHSKLMPEYFTFYIYPLKYDASSLWGQFYGVLYYEIVPFQTIDWRKASNVSIILTGITDNVIKQYFIQGEYIRIENDTLTWKNGTYKRQPDKTFRSIRNYLGKQSTFHCY